MQEYFQASFGDELENLYFICNKEDVHIFIFRYEVDWYLQHSGDSVISNVRDSRTIHH